MAGDDGTAPTGGTLRGEDGIRRCAWCAAAPEYRAYHDTEWGFPVADDIRLFEKLSLEGFQAGLSWLTILRRRDAFRRAFAGFEPHRVARFGTEDVRRLLADSSIIRHRGKIEAVINNAGRLLDLIDAEGSLAHHVWSFAPALAPLPPAPLPPAPLPPAPPSTAAPSTATPPSVTPQSTALAADLRRRGWRFVGPTTVYAFMQSMGLVNDHHPACAIRARAAEAQVRFARP